jgi:redox-sensitive bicupin YhaK (pirin superfamily)
LPLEVYNNLNDPIIRFDHFDFSEAVFDAHPHAGYSALTYLFEESENGLSNYDSHGRHHNILPGCLHWTLGGRGVMHREVPLTRARSARGIQVFVNLEMDKKFCEPAAIHIAANEVPVWSDGKNRIRVVAGEAKGLRSPFAAPQPFLLLDGYQQGNSSEVEIPAGYSVLLYVVGGELSPVAEGISCQTLTEKQAVMIVNGADSAQQLKLESIGPCRWVLLGGTPSETPAIWFGGFAMGSYDQIRKAIQDHADGRMGSLAFFETLDDRPRRGRRPNIL